MGCLWLWGLTAHCATVKCCTHARCCCHSRTPPCTRPPDAQAYSAHSTWKDNIEWAAEPTEWPPTLRPGDVLSVLILYIQWLGIISSMPAPWPSSFRGLLFATSWVFPSAGSTAVSLDCIFTGRTTLPLAIARALAYVFTPIAMTLILLVAFTLPWRRMLPWLPPAVKRVRSWLDARLCTCLPGTGARPRDSAGTTEGGALPVARAPGAGGCTPDMRVQDQGQDASGSGGSGEGPIKHRHQPAAAAEDADDAGTDAPMQAYDSATLMRRKVTPVAAS